MTGLRGITVSVGYDDLLAKTLKQNMRFMDECVVVTAPHDHKTKAVVRSVPNCKLFETNAFYENGAKFNKGRSLESAFDFLGRAGWILIWDADTIFPTDMQLVDLEVGKLYNPPRLILDDPKKYTPEMPWTEAKPTHDWQFPGYFQLFHAEDPHLIQKPWYGVNYTHAGGCDADFQFRWPMSNKVRLKFHVLHLGPRDTNWFGRVSERVDGLPVETAEERKQIMDDYAAFKWKRGGKRVSAFQETIEDNVSP